MIWIIRFLSIIIMPFGLFGCKYYSFTGGSVGNAKTYQVEFFENRAPIKYPGMDREFTLALQDFIQAQTNLNLIREEGDLEYSGEITRYDVSPMSATADQVAAQNRLTVEVNVRYVNNVEEQKDFEKRFSFFYDFPADTTLDAIRQQAFDEIFERITQDIFTASLANW